jgi:hypothetical protein
MKTGTFGGVLFTVAALTFGAAGGFAQSEDWIGEVGTYTGASVGALGWHPVVGGTTGIVTKYAVGLVDTSFIPLGGRTVRHFTDPTTHSQLFNINLTVQIQIPVHHRVVPYGLFGPALIYNRYQIRITPVSGGAAYLTGNDDVKFGFETGAGLRYYIGDTWGLRTEYRYTISAQNYGRILAGVFYQFSAPWPFLARGSSRKRGQGAGL